MLLSMTLLWSGFAGLSCAAAALLLLGLFFPAIIMMFTMRNGLIRLPQLFALPHRTHMPHSFNVSTVIGGTANGGRLVMQSLAMTAGIFFASGYVLTTKKDLSFMVGF